MTDNQYDAYRAYTKKAWLIYAFATLVLIIILVLFVAQDNEEMLFFGLMPAAAAYVFRPTDRYMSRLIFKYTGVSKPEEKE